MIWEDFSAFGTPKNRVSPATFVDWQRRTRGFDDIAAWRVSEMTLVGGGSPERLHGIAATANLLPLVGVPPVMGRTIGNIRAVSRLAECPSQTQLHLSDRSITSLLGIHGIDCRFAPRQD